MRILVVDDSVVARGLLRAVFEAEGIDVIEASSGEQALAMLADAKLRPNLITMDVHMPGMDGYTVTDKLLQLYPLPVVIVTASANTRDAVTAMRALAAGALAVVEKPKGPAHPHFLQDAAQLLDTVRRLAGIPVRASPPMEVKATTHTVAWRGNPKLIAIGASAGGPAALRELLQACLPALPWPVLLVQHIAPGFTASFADWLAGVATLTVNIASDNEPLLPGQIYVAPEGRHLGVDRELRVQLNDGPPRDNWQPSVGYLFENVSERLGADAVGILLSGMGRDGALGLQRLKSTGGLALVQDPVSAVVDGMPQSAIRLGAASEILPPRMIAGVLNSLKARQRS